MLLYLCVWYCSGIMASVVLVLWYCSGIMASVVTGSVALMLLSCAGAVVTSAVQD